LKTPIASIRLYLETLQQRPLEEAKRKEFYRIMLEDTDRLLGTVEQVLKAGEVRHGQRQREEVDFAAVVRDSVDLARLRHKLPPDALRLEPAASSEITLFGSTQELRTAVANLLDNAVKYSRENVNIAVDLLTPDLDTVLLRVRDSGIGIPHSELKRIFKRFYRVQSNAAKNVRGTGLGLLIVRAIARRHGGEVFAESPGEGHGSTFTLRLPRVYRV
jgi:signal transduction histidine kinase